MGLTTNTQILKARNTLTANLSAITFYFKISIKTSKSSTVKSKQMCRAKVMLHTRNSIQNAKSKSGLYKSYTSLLNFLLITIKNELLGKFLWIKKFIFEVSKYFNKDWWGGSKLLRTNPRQAVINFRHFD